MSSGQETPQERGRVFEAEAAEMLGLSLTPGSGNQFHSQSDAQGHLRLSCKSSVNRIDWAEIKRHVSEALDMAQGTGETPALALEDHAGDQYLILRLQDAAEFLNSAATVQKSVRRSAVVRETSRIPVALRDL